MEHENLLVTGGAGFIGSHLVDELMSRNLRVTVLDNLISGDLANIQQWMQNRRFTFAQHDLLNFNDVAKLTKGCDTVLHLAANPDVRLSTVNPEVHYKQNVLATFNLLEAIRKAGTVKVVVFASSSTVYGEAIEIPTPEDYAPMEPISVYGSCKLSCEALLTGYARTYGFRAIICRLANIVGPRSNHGVVYDFVQKLRKDQRELEVLGDGTQTKSYLYIDDCIDGIDVILEKSRKQVDTFNIGSDDQIDVRTIANAVMEEMGLKNVKLRFTGRVEEGRGWVGDIKNMLLETSKLKSIGWMPKYDSEQSIRLTSRNLL
jgi:UDP-glucose 4-epimerase